MRILYLITRAERGGAQVHVLDLVRGLRKDFEIEVASGEEGFLMQEARRLGITCHVIPSLVHPINPAKDLRALFAIRTLIRNRRPHLVHAHTSKAGVLGRVAAYSAGTASIFTAHTWCFAEGTSLAWKLIGVPLERLAAVVGGGIITVSEANRQLAMRERVGKPARITTIHNGVPDETVLPPDFKSDPPAIVMVARFAAQKEHALLLQALARLDLPFHLQLVGDGPNRGAMERLTAQLGLAGKVEFLGDRADVSGILSRASLFALISNWEGFPLSILEAMRAQLPILATDVGGVKESVIDGVNGYLVPWGNLEALTHCLHKLLTSPELRLSMGRASRAMFLRNFTADVMLQKTSAFYSEIFQSAGEPRRVLVTPTPFQSIASAGERSAEIGATQAEKSLLT